MKNAMIVCVMLMCLLFCTALSAATITLGSPLATPSCKLRAAIQTANSGVNSGDCVRTGNLGEAADTIVIGALAILNDQGSGATNYHNEEANLTGDYDIVSDITIQGLHASRSSITAPPLDRLFDVKPGGKLSLRDLTIFGGSVIASTRANGGTIYAAGSNGLSLDRVYVNGGLATNGGSIYLDMTSNSTVTLHNTTIRGGYATAFGGAIYMGGNAGAGQTTEFLNATLSGNFADVSGSAIYDSGARIRLRSSTITRNHGNGPAVYLSGLNAVGLEFVNSILMDNTNPTRENMNLLCNAGTNFVQFANTVYGGATVCNLNSGNSGYSPLKLLPLFDYGAGIPTHALDIGSYAINNGSAVVANGCVPSDARGVARLGACDIGAYEHNVDFTVSSTADLPDATPGDGLCRASNNMCTLRASIMEAIAAGGRRVITLSPGTYTLSQPTVFGNDPAGGDLDIKPSSNVNLPPLTIFILGLGNPSNTHIVGNGSDRVLEVRGLFDYESDDVSNRPISFALHNVTVRGGRLSEDVFKDPVYESVTGGGILIRGGNTLLNQVVVRDNQAESATADESVYGGGVAVYIPRTNSYRPQQFSSARLERFTVIDNQAFSPFFESDPGTAKAGVGGGIYISGPDLALHNDQAISLVNGTVANNHADIIGGVSLSQKAYVSFITVTENSSSGLISPLSSIDTGGIGVFGSNNRVRNSVFAGNLKGNQSNDCYTNGAINGLGYNLLGNLGTCTISGDTTGNEINVDPQFFSSLLSAISTVYVFYSSSAANQSIPLAYCSDEWGVGIYDDAIGLNRPYQSETNCSMGATEFFEFTPLIFVDGFE